MNSKIEITAAKLYSLPPAFSVVILNNQVINRSVLPAATGAENFFFPT